MNARDDPMERQRRSVRLPQFDYAQQGAYFVTVCTQNRACLFGDVADDRMQLNGTGQVAKKSWLAIPDHFPHVRLDEFVIMPNHVHGIIWIVDDSVAATVLPNVGAKNLSPLPVPLRPPPVDVGMRAFRSPSKSVGSIVRGFKISVTKWVRANTDVHDVWQRNYYEHIIRDDTTLNGIRQYIIDNAARWSEDRENPMREGGLA